MKKKRKGGVERPRSTRDTRETRDADGAGVVPRHVMRDEDAACAIRTRGLFATPRRVLVFKALRATPAPLPVDVLAAMLREKADRVTVYRALAAFEEHGIAVRVNVRADREYYELSRAVGGEHHHHLVCQSCGAVEDADVSEPRDFEQNILRQSKQFRTITSHALEFFGTCRLCANA